MKINIVFNRYKVPDGQAPVHLDVYFNRRDRLYVHTAIKVQPHQWDTATQQVTRAHHQYRQFNWQIRDQVRSIENYHAANLQRGITTTGAMLRSYLSGDTDGPMLADFVSQVYESERHRLKPETERQRFSVVRRLREHIEPVPLAKVDYAWVLAYHEHLLTTMKATSTGKNHKLVKRALTRAVKTGLIRENPYMYFRIPEAARRIHFLTPEQLNSIRNYKGVERLHKVRDLFLFQCLTGLAYSDMQQLAINMIQQRGNNRYIINERIKTGTLQLIPLLSEACSIIERYNDGMLCFPRISNQKMNAYLKEIGNICNIGFELTTHLARHTFATLMLGKGLPLETVSHILGHTSTKITQVYAKIVYEKIDADFKRLDIKGL